MKSVNVRNLQHHLGRYLHEVEAGEVLEVRRRGKVIARIVPEHDAAAVLPWPDIEARLAQVFPDGDVGDAGSRLLYEDRGER